MWWWMFAVAVFFLHGCGKTIYKVEQRSQIDVRSHFHSEKSHGSIYVRIILKKLPPHSRSADVGPFYNQPSIFLTALDRVKNNAAYLSSGLVCLQISVCFFPASSLTHTHAWNPKHAHSLAHKPSTQFSFAFRVRHWVQYISYWAWMSFNIIFLLTECWFEVVISQKVA